MDFTENINVQKLILKCDDDSACVRFYDEKQNCHEYDFKTGAFVNLRQLVISCFEPIEEDDDDGLLTCSCGIPACAGFYDFMSYITDEEIFWKLNDSDVFRFNKIQYLEEVKNCLSNLLETVGKIEFLEYFGGESLSKEDIEKFIAPLSNYAEVSKRKFPRHKITIFPKSKYIYFDENNKKIGLRKKELGFFGIDFFGEPYKYYIYFENLGNWASKLANKEQICWSEWNNEGIKYAQQIRNKLPNFFEVWYRFQGEQKADLQIKKI